MKRFISISCTIEIVYEIKNNPTYGFGKDKKLYNLISKREIKQTINNRCIGYWLGKKFFSVKFLKENNMLVRPEKFDLPDSIFTPYKSDVKNINNYL